MLLIPRALLRATLNRLLAIHANWAAYSAEYDAAMHSQRSMRDQRRRR